MVAQAAGTAFHCERCGNTFPSMQRLQHHRAAEHAPRVSADIRRTSQHIATLRDLPRARRARGLSDLRTAISHHIRSNPPQKSTTHLELYLLDKERQRLETELSHLWHRQGRIDERLGEIRRARESLERAAADGEARGGDPALASTDPNGPGRDSGPGSGKWRRMTVEY